MIKIEHLVKNYGNLSAVDDVSFEIESGEVVGLLGPNGAGKSTMMNILTGYLSATSGVVEIGGHSVLDEPLAVKKQVGYLPEQPPLYLDMTVEEYLNFTYELKGCTLNREQHLKEVCDVVKIYDVYKRLIGHLSKGYRQRVGIAQALVGNPEVIIFDEPTVGLDPKQIIEIRNLIRTLGKNHTVILSTHILQEVQAVCDRILIVNKGKIVANELTENITRAVQAGRRFNVKICGPKSEVLSALRELSGVVYAEQLAERDGEAYTYTVESASGTDVRKNLFFTMAQKGFAIVGLETLGMSLEDIFITIVDDTDKPTRQGARRGKQGVSRGDKSALEKELAKDIVRRTADGQRESALGLDSDKKEEK
ncbi:MAG: ATP-binding cassette domain-containing protein [Ruminococcaceae bacterium]|nr:ATP-binding cassette domain-containing protein [Oscillospiraceae bacterium]